MFRGTTPTFYFKINNLEDFSTIKDVWVTFRLREKIFLNKFLSENAVVIQEDEKMISVDLTQDETLSFPEPNVKVQIKIRFDDDKVCASPIFTIPVETPLNSKKMEGD